MYDVWLSHANGLERLINSHAREWLGLPRPVRQLSSLTTYFQPGRRIQMCQGEGVRIIFSSEIAVITLQPDLVLLSKSRQHACIIELTVPWEDVIDERKKLHYSNLAAEAGAKAWKVKVRPVEVGCRGFVASSTTKLLNEKGVGGTGPQQDSKRAVRHCWKDQSMALVKKEGRCLSCQDKQLTHRDLINLWLAASAEGVLWKKAETPYDAEVHTWRCVLVVATSRGSHPQLILPETVAMHTRDFNT